MESKRPHLFIAIDLMKSWKESFHPREQHGKFTAIKGGSRIVTKTGKTGVVVASSEKYHDVRYDDGKKASLPKENVIHANDHAKVTAFNKAAEAKAKRAKNAAAKAKATKTANKTNATGKTGASKTVVDPTAKKGKNLADPAEKRRVPKNERDVSLPKDKLKRDMEAPVLKRNTTHDENSKVQEVKQTIPQKKFTPGGDKENEQNAAAQYQKDGEMDEAKAAYINTRWNSPEVQAILAKPVNKRSAADIKKVAGEITNDNDKLARHLVHTMAASRGMQLIGKQNLIKRHMGAKRSDEGKEFARDNHTVRQDTGVYGDLMQSARATMFQTLHNVLAGSQNPGQSTAIAAHVAQRVRQELHRDIYDLMNDIPAPHEIRNAIGDMRNGELKLTQKLGRTPTHEELANHLEEHSTHFKTAPITRPPHFDQEKQEWAMTNKRFEDPSEKLQALKNYHAQQKTTSIDKNVGSAGEKAVSVGDSMRERTGASTEQGYIEKERQEELKGALPKAMRDMGLTDDEIRVLSMKHSQASETGSKAFLTSPETAQKLNDQHGMSLTSKNVDNLLATAMKKLEHARNQKHPALQQLSLMKSLVMNSIMKSMYEFDLVKSLASWGVDHSILEQVHTKDMYADSLYDLRKSLSPQEYIGSYLTLDGGEVVAKIVEWVLPDNNNLYKSFNSFMTGLKKSMFPHTGGGNHAINEKAKAYVKANTKKYGSMSAQQHSAAKSKGKGLTWSEELLLKNPGSAWITWGGKRILVHSGTGDIIFDSANGAHREDHAEGAQEDKLQFPHEKEALDAAEAKRGEDTKQAWKDHIAAKEKNAGKNKNSFDYQAERDAFAKKNRGVSFDEDGNHQFQPDTELSDDNRHQFDEGIHAFRSAMETWRKEWKVKEGNSLVGGHVKDFLDNHSHKATDAYAELSEEERAKLDGNSKKENETMIGKHLIAKEGVKEALQNYHDTYKSGVNPAQAEEELRQHMKTIGSIAGRNTAKMDTFLKDVVSMNPSSDGNMDALAQSLGEKEMSRAKEEAGKNLLPEGKYMLGNPITGKTMVIEVGGAFTGGRGSRKKDEDGNEEGGKYASVLSEAFDPDGRAHVETGVDGRLSWGSLGKALGYTGKDADNLKAILTQFANTDADKPFMKKIDDDEFSKHRAKTAAGLQDGMLHKEFKLVDQQRGDDKSIKSQTFAQKMPDGTTNHISTDADGMIKDPLMQRLLNQRKPITNEKELNELLKGAVGNRTWVTAHFGGDIHVGDALGHHVQIEYDGKGAPRVVGGKYDGYRYMDKKDVPKGTLDPATGEPVQALFNNGKLADRRFSTVNKVPMKEGGAVMYPDGNTFRKGRIHQMQGDQVKVTDGKGNVIGMFKKSELKEATEQGRILSDSGNAVVKLAKHGVHRMTTNEHFRSEDPKMQKQLDKVQGLFEQALHKAKINSAFEDDGSLKPDIELSDAMHRRLSKVLGRSKAGNSLLQKLTSSYTKELELHVPEHLKAQIEAEGVRVLNNGTARISVGKFEQLRGILAQDSKAGLSLTHEANNYMKDHFASKDRKPPQMEELKANYQPSTVKTSNPEFDKHYKAQFKSDSYLMNPNEGLYSTQLQGVHHFVTRGRGIAGHGMGTGKTILGVIAGLHYKATELAEGRKPKKTLIVAPKGIMSDWGKEIGSHTNGKALYIGSGLKDGTTEVQTAGGKTEKRNTWGKGEKEHHAMDFKTFKSKSAQMADEDHDFHVVNYDTFMRNREHFANSGMYDNIAVDEVHGFKNAKGQRGKALAETTDKFKNVWGLSGTPMENDAREAYSLINTVTGGRHELGNMKEFTDNYMQKDVKGKIIGIKSSKAEKLGDIMANVIQFRGGEDVKYNDGSSIPFPDLAGDQPSSSEERPRQSDFIGNMVNRNRDHNTNNYYGTKHSVTDFDTEQKEVTNTKNGEKYTVTTTTPKNMTPEQTAMYAKYKELENQYLPESKKNELATAAATGMDSGKKDGGNYLTAMQKLQKFLNAPLSHKIYVGAGNALDSDATDAQSAGGTGDKKKSTGLKQGEHYNIDKNGMKRYFESDGNGGTLKNADGTPRELPPLHHGNPKAKYLQDRLHGYLDDLQRENKERVKRGQVPMVPKVVLKSSYTTFGTDIIDNVLKDVRNTHPIFKDLHNQGFKDLGQGRFTGDADDREETKTGFRGDKNDYTKNQGNLWATTVSPAGKEGVDFGNAHAMFHFDQDWNPQKMAQFTARVRRSDSWKTHKAMGRANQVRVESLHMPNTVEDFMFNAQDAKIKGVEELTSSTKTAEKVPKLGDTEGKVGYGHRGFTSNKKARKPKESSQQGRKPVQPSVAGGGALRKMPAASADKAMKLVILL